MSKEWIIEGKYTTGRGSEWEVIDTVAETDIGGPNNGLKGLAYGQWLTREYREAHHPNPVRMRPKHSGD